MALRNRHEKGHGMFSAEVASSLVESPSGAFTQKTLGRPGDDSYQGAVTRALGRSGIQQLKSRAEVNEQIKKVGEDVEKLNGRAEEKRGYRSQKDGEIEHLRGEMKKKRRKVAYTFAKIGAAVLFAVLIPLGGLVLGIGGVYSSVIDGNQVRAEGVVIRQELTKSIESDNEQVINAVNDITGNEILITVNGGKIMVNGKGITTTNGTTTYTFYNVKQNAQWLANNAYYDSYNGSNISNADMRVLDSVTKGQFGPNTQNKPWQNIENCQVAGGFVVGGFSLVFGGLITALAASDGNLSAEPIRRRRQQKKEMAEKMKDVADLDKQIGAVDGQIAVKNKELGALKDQLRGLDGVD